MDLTGAIMGDPLGMLLAAVVTLLATIWLLVPFALFGLKRRIDGVRAEEARTREALLAELRRTNELLARGEPRVEAAPAVAGEPAVEGPQRRRPLVARRD